MRSRRKPLGHAAGSEGPAQERAAEAAGAVRPRGEPSAALERVVGGSGLSVPQDVLRLQQTAGNRVVVRLVAPPTAEPRGRPLEPAVRAQMETSFNADFSGVRIHEGIPGRAPGVLAYTHRDDIYFAPGHYAPSTQAGRRLIGHELTHVLQQRLGRAGAPQDQGGTLTFQPELEAEADLAGARAADRQPVGEVGAHSSAGGSGDVVQPKLGFELEMLVLTDVHGRPPRDKAKLGTYGNLDLVVDRSSLVKGRTPIRAAHARTKAKMDGQPGEVSLGPYDLPEGHERRRATATQLDPRSKLDFGILSVGGWRTASRPMYLKVLNRWVETYQSALGGGDRAQAPRALTTLINLAKKLVGRHAEVHIRQELLEGLLAEAEDHLRQWQRSEVPKADTGLLSVNGWVLATRPWQLRVLDHHIAKYDTMAKNWEDDLARQHLRAIGAAGQKLLSQPEQVSLDVAVLQQLVRDAQAHLAFWNRPNIKKWDPQQLLPEVRKPRSAEWTREHPVEGHMGGDAYDTILEIVTQPYDAETKEGAEQLELDMTMAKRLADEIESKTAGFTRRIPLIALGARPETGSVFVGNERLFAGRQTTDASIQSTLAVELSQLSSFFLRTMGPGARDRQFKLKHQSDTDGVNRVDAVLSQAPVAALGAVMDQSPDISVENLVGLVTLVCQYVLMGEYFEWSGDPQLDKNVVPLLSRTDLAKIYRQNVPKAERDWAAARLGYLLGAIFRHTGRDPDDLLLRPAKVGGPNAAQPTRSITARTFAVNVFTKPSDGFTPYLDEGIFKQMGPEAIPGAPRPGDEKRTAPVFELRNMVPLAGERFPRSQWVPLTKYLIALLTELNAPSREPVQVK